jgi:5-methylcytosine-specific restriction enzyme A
MPTSVPTHRPTWLPSKLERDRAYGRARQDKEEQAFYHSKPWVRLRDIQLCDKPYCEECLREELHTPAVMVHHIKAIKDEPALRLDQSNLQSLCHSCHSRIHACVTR